MTFRPKFITFDCHGTMIFFDMAGAARDHPGILMIGLVLSVALMGIAANVIAHYIERFRWIAYLGLAVIIYVALKMIYEGFVDQQVGLLTLF